MGSPSPPSSQVLRAGGYRRMRWKNDAGWTSEILKVHDGEERDTNDWAWRLSIAEIESDAPFSAFPGVERVLVLLSGNGLRLRFDDGESHALRPPHDQLRFAGERAAFGELIDGPTRDFNLMWKRDLADAALWHRPLVGSMVVFVEPAETWAVHVLAGQARFADESGLGGVQMGDTAILVAADARTRYVLDGGGEVLLVRVRPVDPA
ncbi:HutD family protein [Thermomonas sp.]|jgi:environmental stress-induced protein Ves|uniref:HutD/Ves family protein n=1 Tax=Thermomonas sp. TaxID=1971895 RepID=UPI0026218216|nr:HutD family protein [Thermomonas sp.]MBK9669686.1 HutD family protein [Thermomonas sp.]MBL0227362.1 HutD family protein [Thermomonas sp.]